MTLASGRGKRLAEARQRAREGPPPREVWLRWAPIPGTPQEGFFDDDTPEAKLLFSGGYGSGKTTTLVAKALKLSAINAPHPGIVTVPDFGHFLDTLLPSLFERDPETDAPWFLDGFIENGKVFSSQCTYSERHHVFEWEGGGPWHIQSAKYVDSIKGPQRAWGAMDEPGIAAYEAYRATVARIRAPQAKLRQFIASGTPEGLNWLADVFTTERAEGSIYRIYRMSTRQNTELLKHQPDYVRQVLENATEAEARAYIGGEMVNLVGALAYPQFARDVHWRTDVPELPTLPLRISFDFNVDPMASVAVQIVPDPTLGKVAHVISAIVDAASWTPEVCKLWIERYGRAACRARGLGDDGWPGGCVVYGDATGGARSTVSLRSNYDFIKELLLPEFPQGFALHPSIKHGNPPQDDRLNAVNRAFRDAAGAVRCWIRKTLPAETTPTRELVRSLEMTVKAPGSNVIWKGGRDTTSHAGDALGYVLAAEMPVVKPRRITAASMFGGQT